MSLKDQAIAAHKEAHEYEAEKEAKLFVKRIKATEIDFEKRFGSYHVISPGTCDTVSTDDGLEFRARFVNSYGTAINAFELRGVCPDCGAGCYSRRILNLLHLGEQIEDFEPGRAHKCPPV